jgi:hypothetical protein
MTTARKSLTFRFIGRPGSGCPSSTLTLHTSVSSKPLLSKSLWSAYEVVSLAGNKNPFLVTVILACCQLIAVVVVAFTTDKFGRRPLTLYPYMVTVLAVYGLGIIGCFDYSSPKLGSLLVSRPEHRAGFSAAF